MNTVSIPTAQHIALDYDIASVGERLAGSLIDFAIKGAYIIMVILLWSILFGNSVWGLLFLIPALFYDLCMEQLFNGQSLGKRIMKIRVISLDGTQPTFGQYLLRWIFRLVDFGLMNGVVALVCVAATDKRQRVGDMVAHTTVIKTEPRTLLQHTLYMPTADDYQALYPEVTRLSDRDIQLIKSLLVQASKTDNPAILYQTAEKVKTILQLRSSLEPEAFLQQVLSDYNHLTSREQD
ncbi:RDD family protein [Compostibacter hankyongensis]|uniref:RDD family protein n=1 Tax=Compostibacter hankyongensis TaxID=1007089 RepID=A0ABP8FFQ6_9BACT